MRKIAKVVLPCVLAAGMGLSLTACTMEVKTDNGVYYIDTDELIDNLKDTGSEAIENIGDTIEDGAEEAKSFFGGLISSIASGAAAAGEAISENVGMVVNSAAEHIDEAKEAVSILFSEWLSEDTTDEKKSASVFIPEGIADGDVEEITVEVTEEFPEEYEEALTYLKLVMEASGLGEYYDVLVNELVTNPDEVLTLMESGDIDGLLKLLANASK